jgi:hypothetical protein
MAETELKQALPEQKDLTMPAQTSVDGVNQPGDYAVDQLAS